jgi:hypothetical protein
MIGPNWKKMSYDQRYEIMEPELLSGKTLLEIAAKYGWSRKTISWWCNHHKIEEMIISDLPELERIVYVNSRPANVRAKLKKFMAEEYAYEDQSVTNTEMPRTKPEYTWDIKTILPTGPLRLIYLPWGKATRQQFSFAPVVFR